MNEEFPSTDTPFTNPIKQGDKIVILSTGNRPFEKADEALRQSGLIAKFITRENIQHSDVHFVMTFIEVSHGPKSSPDLTHDSNERVPNLRSALCPLRQCQCRYRCCKGHRQILHLLLADQIPSNPLWSKTLRSLNQSTSAGGFDRQEQTLLG